MNPANYLNTRQHFVQHLSHHLDRKDTETVFSMTPWFSMMHHLTTFAFLRRVQHIRKYCQDKQSLKLWTCIVTLTVKTTVFFSVLFFRRPKDCNNTLSNQLSRRYGRERREINCAVTLTLTLDKPTQCLHLSVASGDAHSFRFRLQKVK